MLQVLGKLLKESPSPALNKTDDDGRTALHLALLHRMPKQFIVVLVQYLKQSELDREDKRRRRAVDYLVSTSTRAKFSDYIMSRCTTPRIRSFDARRPSYRLL